jgi:hypothetical protein
VALASTAALGLGGCGLTGGLASASPAAVAGRTTAPVPAGAQGVGAVVDTARSLAAQANGQASQLQALASRLGMPVGSLAARLGGTAASPGVGTGAALCALLPPVEIAAATGVPVGDGMVGGPSGAQCGWTGLTTAKGVSRVAVRVSSATVKPPHAAVRVPGVPGASYVSAVHGGWEAAAAHGRHAVVVTMTGPRASKAAVSAVLSLALARV